MIIRKPSMEAINYQVNSALFGAIVDWVNLCRKSAREQGFDGNGDLPHGVFDNMKQLGVFKRFDDLVEKHTGMRMTIGSLVCTYGHYVVNVLTPSTAQAVSNPANSRNPAKKGLAEAMIVHEPSEEGDALWHNKHANGWRSASFTLDRKNGKVTWDNYNPLMGYLYLQIGRAHV